MSSDIKITLDSKNRENNQVIVNGVDITQGVTKLSIIWDAEKALEVSVDYR